MSKVQSKNAIRHGAYSTSFVLPWESEDDFSKLLEQLRDELCPTSMMQEIIVKSIAGNYWKLKRLRMGTHLRFGRAKRCTAAASSPERIGGYR
jgi:hypothetical protein